ncbi:MAG: hypothetical protein U5L11_10120 [Arhodomonas sp.]|nr:hypothetical protein [Arhodomonas sp.]
MNGAFERLQRNSYLSGGNASYMEALYEAYLNDRGLRARGMAGATSRVWRPVTALPPRGRAPQPDPREFAAARPSSRPRQRRAPADRWRPDVAQKQAAVLRLINAYRVRGHQRADVDPLYLRDKPEVPDLDPAYHGLVRCRHGPGLQHRARCSPPTS